MTLEECKNMHKFGPFIKDNDNEFHRVCLCCKKVSYYPVSIEINNEIKKQEDVNQIFDYVMNQDLVSNSNSDNFIMLANLIFDDLSYLDINNNTKESFLNKFSSYNKYFNKDNVDRFNLINEFLEYFNLFFKKEELEIKYGIGSFNDEDYVKLDLFGQSVSNKFDKELEMLYDLREKKESSVKR